MQNIYKTILYSMRYTLLFATFLFCFHASSQERFTFLKIVDSIENKPVYNANVKVLNPKDSSVIYQSKHLNNGLYQLKFTESENLLIRVEATNFVKQYKLISVKNDTTLIVMLPLLKEFKTVSVTSKTPFIVQDIKQTVINPDALLTTAGISAIDLLERAPGIMVDEQGGIRLQGLSGVSVYINDQLLNLAEEERIQYLKSIPAENIQNIVIMTNPSSKYPAVGSGGVIVIRMKKSRAKGFNGRWSNNAGTGRYIRHSHSLSFNYRVNKINFFGNGSYGLQNNFQDLTIKRGYYNSDGSLMSSFVQNTYIRKRNEQAQGTLGADIYLSDKQTLTISLNEMNLNADRHTGNYAEIRDGGRYLKNQVKADIPISTLFKNQGANAYYDLNLDSGRSGVSVYAEWSSYDSRNKQSTLNRLMDSTGQQVSQTLLIGELPSSIHLLTTGVDTRKDYRKYGNMEMGLRSSRIRSSNYAGFMDDVNGTRTINNQFTNDFDYAEDIQAAYWNHSISKKRLSVQAGLRWEHTHSKGYQHGNANVKDSSFSRQYHSLFPTCYISYALDSHSMHIVGVNYGRRIDRPNYQDMNPFIYPLDRYTLYAGNPFIKPTFTNEMELSYIYKNNWRVNGVLGLTDNLISETIEQSGGIFYSRPGNIGKQLSLVFNMSGGAKIGKWLRMNVYTEVSHNRFAGTLYGQDLKNNGTFFYIGPNFNFTLHPKWNAELSGNYQSKVASAQFVLIPVGSARAGIAWQFNKKGSLRFAVTDFLYTMKPGGDILSLNQSTASWKSFLDTRVAMLSFSYQFNRGQSLNRLKDDQQGAEKQRVKVG
ncbi:MAG TPA: outer membrane beta-barrel family protein [Bacteroidia bacterium]